MAKKTPQYSNAGERWWQRCVQTTRSGPWIAGLK